VFSCSSLDAIIAFDAGYQMRYTLIERKYRMPQIQGVEGEAVVKYAEPLTTL
jgi:hypothetical protein